VALNHWLKHYAQSQHGIYLDYYSHMLDSNGMLGVALADDGLHPNAKGYRIMADLAEKAITQALTIRDPSGTAYNSAH